MNAYGTARPRLPVPVMTRHLAHVMARFDRIGIRISGRGGQNRLLSSCSGLTRASVDARRRLKSASVFEPADPRVKPEDDDQVKVIPCQPFNLMPMRLDRAIGDNTMERAMARASRAMTSTNSDTASTSSVVMGTRESVTLSCRTQTKDRVARSRATKLNSSVIS